MYSLCKHFGSSSLTMSALAMHNFECLGEMDAQATYRAMHNFECPVNIDVQIDRVCGLTYYRSVELNATPLTVQVTVQTPEGVSLPVQTTKQLGRHVNPVWNELLFFYDVPINSTMIFTVLDTSVAGKVFGSTIEHGRATLQIETCMQFKGFLDLVGQLPSKGESVPVFEMQCCTSMHEQGIPGVAAEGRAARLTAWWEGKDVNDLLPSAPELPEPEEELKILVGQNKGHEHTESQPAGSLIITSFHYVLALLLVILS